MILGARRTEHLENRLLAPYRERIVSLAEGRVLEVGVGSGLNLPFYTDRATEVLGLEPHPKLLRMASQKSGRVPVKLIEGAAESIPMDAAGVDTVVTAWTLCTIPNVLTALTDTRQRNCNYFDGWRARPTGVIKSGALAPPISPHQ